MADIFPNKHMQVLGNFDTTYNMNLCFQANDSYYKCIDDQNVPLDKINKFKCINEMYAFEQNCHPVHISRSKKLFRINQGIKSTFSNDKIDYLNLRAKYISAMSPEEAEFISKLNISKI